MEVFGIALSLFLLIFFAYRGYSVILFAPVWALMAAAAQGLPVMPAYTELFMAKAVTYIKSFFPVFMLGAVFGKLMEDTGMAKSIAHTIIEKLGPRHAILSTVLSCAILTYGGVSLFVVVFAVYPFAAALFKEAGMPKRFIPGCIILGAFTFTMDCLPGTPQIQNIIPTNFFGTSVYAAPLLGTVSGVIIFVVGMWWLNYRVKAAVARGEGYGDHKINEPELQESGSYPSWQLSVLPLLTVLVVNYIGNTAVWNPDLLQPFMAMKVPLMVPAVKNVVSIWALIIGLVCGILLAVAIGGRRTPPGGLAKALNAGTIGSLLAIMNTASEVGYGNVIASLPGFKTIANAMLSIHIGNSPLVSEAITVTSIAGITGSASGGMAIALDLMAASWLEWANAIGMSPEVLHRIASMASGGLDTLPHNGAVITLLAVCGLTHRQAYPDIFAMTIIKTTMAFVAIALYTWLGIV
ncbi:MAG: GntP family permease [Sporomusaceae bacterium]|nr:GntP family permease [Sporomusaceae bacterium]